GLDPYGRWHFGGPPSSTVFEQMLIGFQQRVDLAAIVPAADFADVEFLSLIDHVLERVGEVELPTLPRRALHDVIDAVKQRAPILHVLQTDVRASRDWRAGLLDDLGHVSLLIRHDHAEALIVLHLFAPDDAVRIDFSYDRQVGVEPR